MVEGVSVEQLAADRIRRDALLWNFTVLGEAAAQLSDELKQELASVAWRQPARLRNRIIGALPGKGRGDPLGQEPGEGDRSFLTRLGRVEGQPAVVLGHRPGDENAPT